MARRHRRKQKKKKLLNKTNIIGFLIVALMSLSGIGYFWGSQEGGSSSGYGEYRFSSYNNKWYVKIGDDNVEFSFHPDDLENLEVGDAISIINNSRVIYFTFEPDSKLVSEFETTRLELENELDRYFGIYPDIAVSKQSPDYENFPIVNCTNATVFFPVLYLKEGNETLITQEGPCVILQAKDFYDVPALKDRLMYGLFGIM